METRAAFFCGYFEVLEQRLTNQKYLYSAKRVCSTIIAGSKQ